MMKKMLFTILLTGLLVHFTVDAQALEQVDMQHDQRAYGAYVASIDHRAPSLRTRRRDSAAQRSTVLLRTDGCQVSFDDLGADLCVTGPGNRCTLVFSSADSADAAVRALNANAHVLYAEPDSEIAACDTAVIDAIDFNTYGAPDMGFQYLLSWARRCEGQTRVAIIDSGIYRHPDFADRLSSGWDYVDNDADATNDDFGHGTHVAGIVADCTQGVQVSLHAIKVLDADGKGKASNAANAILEAVEDGYTIINLSFSGTKKSDALDDAVLTALASGCTVVVAAGNNAMDTSGVWPAHLTEEGVIVVGAANADGNQAAYSNFGSSVDLYAYGTTILSCSNTGGYMTRTGTSQAAPHISAACALLDVIGGGLSPVSMERRLRAAAGEVSGSIPLLDALVPQRIACHLVTLKLGVGETLVLPTQAQPLSCDEQIVWRSSDDSVVTVDETGLLTARCAGSVQLTGSCANFEQLIATVNVDQTPSSKLCLPAGLTALEDEAFVGTAADYMVIPQGVTRIGVNPLDAHTVILCAAGSCAAEMAETSDLQYLSIEQE